MIDVAPNDGLCGPIAYNRVKEGINQPLSLNFPIQLWLISKVPRFSLSLSSSLNQGSRWPGGLRTSNSKVVDQFWGSTYVACLFVLASSFYLCTFFCCWTQLISTLSRGCPKFSTLLDYFLVRLTAKSARKLDNILPKINRDISVMG